MWVSGAAEARRGFRVVTRRAHAARLAFWDLFMDALAVLISGGLDSAILLGDALGKHEPIQPLYIRCGLLWESAELAHLHRYLKAIACAPLRPLVVLEQPVADLYGAH